MVEGEDVDEAKDGGARGGGEHRLDQLVVPVPDRRVQLPHLVENRGRRHAARAKQVDAPAEQLRLRVAEQPLEAVAGVPHLVRAGVAPVRRVVRRPRARGRAPAGARGLRDEDVGKHLLLEDGRVEGGPGEALGRAGTGVDPRAGQPAQQPPRLRRHVAHPLDGPRRGPPLFLEKHARRCLECLDRHRLVLPLAGAIRVGRARRLEGEKQPLYPPVLRRVERRDANVRRVHRAVGAEQLNLRRAPVVVGRVKVHLPRRRDGRVRIAAAQSHREQPMHSLGGGKVVVERGAGDALGGATKQREEARAGAEDAAGRVNRELHLAWCARRDYELGRGARPSQGSFV
mmetsp:Transcript_3903/g.12177  ORF Transcript_3903/g.12177 Transcript_3903/m.12177 type:complete len:343 (-) Transcript_3903:6-1034(-)